MRYQGLKNDRISELGVKIRKYRKYRHLSQIDLSEMAQVTPQYLSDIENGKVNISIDVFIRLVEALDVSAAEMLGIKTSAEANLPISELSDIFSDCSDPEKEMLLKVLRNIKDAVKEMK